MPSKPDAQLTVGLIGAGAIGSAILGAIVGRTTLDIVIGARVGFDRLIVDGVEPPVDKHVRVVTTPPVRTPLDIVVLATKAHQTIAARCWLDGWVNENTIVVVLQNGVEQVESIRALAPHAEIVPAVVSCPTRRLAPGHVEVGARAELIVPDDESGRAVADLFRDSYVKVSVVEDWITVAWSKLLFNSAAGAVTVLTRRSNAILRDSEARELTLRLMEEAALVARAEGAHLPPEAVEAILERYLAVAGDHTSSITADRLASVPCEWQARNEVVVRKAAAHGIEAPLNALVTTLLRLSEP